MLLGKKLVYVKPRYNRHVCTKWKSVYLTRGQTISLTIKKRNSSSKRHNNNTIHLFDFYVVDLDLDLPVENLDLRYM